MAVADKFKQLEEALFSEDDDVEFTSEALIRGHEVEDNATAFVDEYLQQLQQQTSLLPQNESPAVNGISPGTEQLPWPLAEARLNTGTGALGGPLLRQDFVSDFVQIRRFKEKCVSQLQEIQAAVDDLLERNTQTVDISCEQLQVRPVEQMLHQMLNHDLQALCANGRSGSFVKRPPYSNCQRRRPESSTVLEDIGTGPSLTQDGQLSSGQIHLELHRERGAQALSAESLMQNSAQGAMQGEDLQQELNLSDLDLTEAMRTPSQDSPTALLGAADSQLFGRASDESLLGTTGVSMQVQESVDPLLGTTEAPMDQMDWVSLNQGQVSEAVAVGKEQQPKAPPQASLHLVLSGPEVEQPVSLTEPADLHSQQRPAESVPMEGDAEPVPIENQTVAILSKEAQPLPGSSEPATGQEGTLMSEAQEAQDRGPMMEANRKEKKKRDAQGKEKRKAVGRRLRSGRGPPGSLIDNAALQERLGALAGYRDDIERMRMQSPLHCIRESPDDQRAPINFKRMHCYTQDDEFPSCEEPVPHEVVIMARIFHPSNRNTGYQELLVLGSQHLTQLRDCISCPLDVFAREAGMDNPSGYLFIEDTFFDDMRRAPSATRYSTPIVEWAAAQPSPPGAAFAGPVRYEQKDMERYVFEDLNVRVGAEYLFCHQGNCEHKLVFTDVRMLNRFDCLDLSAYPLLRHRTPRPPKKCQICIRQQASKITVADEMVSESPCFFCKQCFDALHRSRTGELHPADLEVYSFAPDM